MMSAGASIELDASAERVWQVVADLDAYADWNPWFRQVRGTLRADDRLAVDVRFPNLPPPDRKLGAIVLDVHRHRRLRWLLALPPGQMTADRPSGQPDAGLYDLEVVPLGPGRVRLVQRILLPSDPAICPLDQTELRRLVETMNGALRERVAWASENGPSCRQIAGTIRVRSHAGRPRSCAPRRAGLLGCVADLVGRWPRLAA